MRPILARVGVVIACSLSLVHPRSAGGDELSLTLTGVLVYKGEGKRYTVIAPAGGAHTAFIRFPASSGVGTGFQPSGEFPCDKKQWRFVTLRYGEQITIDSGVAAELSLAAGPVSDSLVHLKELSGSRSDLDDTGRARASAHAKPSARFLLDRGALTPVLEDDKKPRLWTFYEFDEETQTKGDVCLDSKGKPIQVCGISGMRLTLPLRPGTRSVRLLSSKDKQRYVDLAVTAGIAEAVAGNSRAEDIVCLGKKVEGPDEDFVHHYAVVTSNQHERPCIPYPEKACDRKAPIEIRSKGGSDCLGSQWP
jgi:hypothetical protein